MSENRNINESQMSAEQGAIKPFSAEGFRRDIESIALDRVLDDRFKGYSFKKDFKRLILDNTEDVSLKVFFWEVSHGCSSGCVSGLIYNDEIKEIYVNNLDSFEDYLLELEKDFGYPIELDAPRSIHTVWAAFEMVCNTISDPIEEELEVLLGEELPELTLRELDQVYEVWEDGNVQDLIEDVVEDQLLDCSPDELFTLYNELYNQLNNLDGLLDERVGTELEESELQDLIRYEGIYVDKKVETLIKEELDVRFGRTPSLSDGQVRNSSLEEKAEQFVAPSWQEQPQGIDIETTRKRNKGVKL